ncbi:MAG: hypothetical protein R3F19_06735 [Verrucomicrobiales bacterium]
MSPESISFTSAMQANPGLVVALLLCVGPALVLSFIAFMIRRAGASLRPILFIGGLFLPIVIPFGIGQLVLARFPVPDPPPEVLAVRHGQFLQRELLFGPGISPDLIRNAKGDLPGILNEAEVAEVGMTISGETVLIAQFLSDADTTRAASAYHRGFGLANTSGDEKNGWRATRMQGDYIEMLRTRRQLFVWSGLSKEAAAARRAASNLQTNFSAIMAAPVLPLFPSLQPLASFFAPPLVKISGTLLLIAGYCLWFFKGSTWSSSIQAAAGVPIASKDELVSRISAFNNHDLPFVISEGDSPDEFIADWRYADQKWIDFAQAHRMKKTFRIRLSLDEAKHVVRATDWTAEFDWAAGQSKLSIQWKIARGLVLFQREQQTVWGLRPNQTEGLDFAPGYTYRFDLNEMKAPIIAAITRSGWTWRPTVW